MKLERNCLNFRKARRYWQLMTPGKRSFRDGTSERFPVLQWVTALSRPCVFQKNTWSWEGKLVVVLSWRIWSKHIMCLGNFSMKAQQFKESMVIFYMLYRAGRSCCLFAFVCDPGLSWNSLCNYIIHAGLELMLITCFPSARVTDVLKSLHLAPSLFLAHSPL